MENKATIYPLEFSEMNEIEKVTHNQYQYKKGSCVKAASFFVWKNSNVANASHKP